MIDEEKIILAFIFKRSGKEKLTPSEIYLPLSIDLKWFSPKQAKDFVNQALEKKLLIRKKEITEASFDIKNVEIPVGFHPSMKTIGKKKDKVKKPKKTADMVEEISKKTNTPRDKILEIIGEIQKEKNICFGTAALLIGKEHEVSLESFIKEAEDEIFKENKE